MAVIKAISSKAGIGQALDYVTKEEKTEDKWYAEEYADNTSLGFALVSLALSIFFAEEIRAFLPINLLLLLILVHIVYVLIRWYVKGCMRSRGYY